MLKSFTDVFVMWTVLGKLKFIFICLIFNSGYGISRVLISSLNSGYHLIYLSHPLWKCIMPSVYFFRKYPNIQDVMKFNEKIIPYAFIWNRQLTQCILVVIIIPYLTCTHGLTVNHSYLKRKWNKTKVTLMQSFSPCKRQPERKI